MENKISIVIPVRDSMNMSNKEIIYAIRSFEKSFKSFGDVFIVGDRINCLKGVKYIHCKDDRGSKFKERNIFRKIMAAVNHPDVTDDFIFANDDHLVLGDFDPNNLPFFHKGMLEDTMAKNIGDYRKSLNHTRKYLISNDKPLLDFDTHFPIIYNKKKFIDTFVCSDLNWNQPFGYVIKSLYANMNDIIGEYGGDCKVQQKMSYHELKNKIGDKQFFSTSDKCLNEDMMKYLNEMFPNKSKFER